MMDVFLGAAHQQNVDHVHFERLTTLGEMMANIPHEVGHPRYAMSNFATGCTRNLESRFNNSVVTARRWSRDISDHAPRTARINRRFRGFSRSNPVEWVRLDFNDPLFEASVTTKPEKQCGYASVAKKISTGWRSGLGNQQCEARGKFCFSLPCIGKDTI